MLLEAGLSCMTVYLYYASSHWQQWQHVLVVFACPGPSTMEAGGHGDGPSSLGHSRFRPSTVL